jgi:superfamily I DNA/RNA helicase
VSFDCVEELQRCLYFFGKTGEMLHHQVVIFPGLEDVLRQRLILWRFVGMTRFVSPPKSELSNLRQPLEEGEWRVFEFFDKYLPEQWEIYVQPHLNGLRPDFVLLNPYVGIVVFEIKNWNLDAFERKIEKQNGSLILFGYKDGKKFSLQKENPIEKIKCYKKEIQQIYCPRLNGKGQVAVIGGVIFPSASDARVLSLFSPYNLKPKYNPIIGQDTLKNGNIYSVVPDAKRTSSIYMKPELAKDLRLWLVEPDAPKEQREPLILDKKQKEVAFSRTSTGYRRVKGSAGSGKSIALAVRAANLIRLNKKVLVVYYNITLRNYLADLAVRAYPSARKDGTWLHFHHWCERICRNSDLSHEWNNILKKSNNFPDEEIIYLMQQILSNPADPNFCYDAILVDEGQDYKLEWWNLLRKVLKPGGEMLLVADHTQDIYGTGRVWTEEKNMLGAGFPGGKWLSLENSYRLPTALIYHLKEFINTYLNINGTNIPESGQGELFQSHLRWVQVSSKILATSSIDEVLNIMKFYESDKISVSDITILVDNRELGIEIENLLYENNLKVIGTFCDDEDEIFRKKTEKGKKLSFFKGDARIKLTTIHSYKGWEARILLICVNRVKNQRDMALLYTAMTRLKWSNSGSFITIVCAEPDLAKYGKTWPDFENLCP